jgi:hypothetical protein
VAITVNVAGAATPTPGQPTATPMPGQPTATPTVTPTPVPDTPTATWTPVIVVVTETPTPTPTGCTLDAAFVADVTVPDGTVFAAGARIDKIWRIRNSGSCSWDSGYTWVLVSGDQMGAAASQAVPATAAGANVDIGVTMYAPSTPGTYTSYWRMKNSGGEVFGQTCSVQIVVPAPATATPTATPTVPPPPEAEYSLVADKSTVNASLEECVTLTWRVRYVAEAYLDGVPLVGESGTRTDCPCHSRDYNLHVVKTDGSTADKTVSVTVTGSCPSSGLPDRPTQLSPNDGAVFDVVPRTVIFQWSAVSGTDVTYGIEIQAWIPLVPGPGGSWEDYESKTGLTSPTYTMSDFIGAHPGQWRVWSHNASGDSPKSGWWEFEFTR